MNQTLLGYVFTNIKGFTSLYEEEPDLISLRRPNGTKLSASVVGPAFCLVSGWDLNGCVLRVNKKDMATGPLEIMLWMVECAPKTLKEVIRLSLEYERQELADAG